MKPIRKRGALPTFGSAQWVVNEDADGDSLTDDVYGTLKRDVLSTVHRRRRLLRHRKLALPYSYLFTPVSMSYDPDFSTKSLRGNVVLRWEYRRGSTLFVVWDLSQADYSRPGIFKPWSDIGTAFGRAHSHADGQGQLSDQSVTLGRGRRSTLRCALAAHAIPSSTGTAVVRLHAT